MKNIWKKIIATCCVAVMLMTLPGVNVLANEFPGEEMRILDMEEDFAEDIMTDNSLEICDEVSIQEESDAEIPTENATDESSNVQILNNEKIGEDQTEAPTDEISGQEVYLIEDANGEERCGYTNHSRDEAVAWITARKNEKWAVNYDGIYGPQCVDLIMYYFDYLVGYHLSGSAYQYVGRTDLPSGWYYTSTPSPGDIAVWGANVGIALSTGHVALVQSVGSGSFSYVDVNGATGQAGSGSISNSNPSTFIHPDFPSVVSVSFIPWSNDNYTYIRETDASIGMEINVSGGTITSEGMYLYDNNGSYLASASNPTHTLARVYFQVNAEMGYTLQGGTTYKYKFYAIVNGQTYWSNEFSFSTIPGSTPSDEGWIVVGNGVKGKNVYEGGKNILYLSSKGGTLYQSWQDKIQESGITPKSIDIIKFTDDSTKMYLPVNCSDLFNNLDVEQIDFKNIVSSEKVLKMNYMFLNCEKLTNLDLSSFDTSKVTDMNHMFFGCDDLISLDLRSFNTSKVTNMSYMFACCIDLTSINVSSFNTSNVTNMNHMFYNCGSSLNLDLKNFNTSNVTDMASMFASGSLSSLNLSSFDTSNVTSMDAMFFGDGTIRNLDISSFDISNVKDLDKDFLAYTKLQLLRTPKKNIQSGIILPSTMYDSAGTAYTELPILSKSIVLSKKTSVSECNATISPISYTYDGNAKNPTISVKNGTTTLTNNTDYSVAYSNNINAGTATATVTGKGNYTGTITISFSIAKASPTLKFASSSLSKKTGDAAFTNTLTKTTDGAVTFKSSNTSVATVNSTSGKVTIKGAGTATITATAAEGTNYKSGSASYTLKVTASKMDISGCTVTLSATSYTYNGKAKKPAVTVTNASTTLAPDTDYTVSYSDNTNAGTATVTITGKGNYTGTTSATFTIKKAAAKLTFANASVSKITTDAAFTNALTKMTDGTVTFKSSNTGVATVSSTSGLVTIKGAGTANITATASAGTNYKAGSASYTLTVTAPVSAGFSDVQDPSHPYYKAIYWAADAGITKGYSDGTFGIDRACTRSEAVMFLWRMAGKPAPVDALSSPFKDVPKSHAHYKAILWASQRGITKGYSDGTFGINKTCTRGQIMTFIWRFKGQPAPKAAAKSPFSDVPKNHAYYKAILWGSQNKITNGFSDGTFGINKNCTRGQIVTFLYRAK